MEVESARASASAPHSGAVRALVIALRLLQVASLSLTAVWVFGPLGGVRLRPELRSPGYNSTSRLFNWHPLLMVLAYVVLMAEALSAYSSPVVGELRDRPQKKAYHAALHAAAAATAGLGLAAAVISHTASLPNPVPNLYSAHSFLGLLALSAFLAQALGGLAAYVWPKGSAAFRERFGATHRFAGLATFLLGLVAAALGAQEKATFLQLGAHAGVRSAALVLPAVLQLLLAGVGLVLVGRVALERGASARREAAVERVPLFSTRASDI